LQPVAHALLNAAQQIRPAIEGLSPAQLTSRPEEIASIAFHVMHMIGSLDRLLTYARGEALSDEQRNALAAERAPDAEDVDAAALLAAFDDAVSRALDQLRATDESILLDHRAVGRARLPSTALGLLFHGGEHTVRHAGQIVTTAKLVRTKG
jgi:uncharacterized damage-inducible protein DinB